MFSVGKGTTTFKCPFLNVCIVILRLYNDCIVSSCNMDSIDFSFLSLMLVFFIVFLASRIIFFYTLVASHSKPSVHNRISLCFRTVFQLDTVGFPSSSNIRKLTKRWFSCLRMNRPKWRTKSSWIAGSWSCCRTPPRLEQKQQQQKRTLMWLHLANVFQRAVAMSERYIGRVQRGYLLLRPRCDYQPDPWVQLQFSRCCSSYKWRRRCLPLQSKTPTCKTTTALLNNDPVFF